MKIVTSPTQEPVITTGYVPWSYERSLDPWHADAFPLEFRHAGTTGERKSGWMGVDWVGNPLIFVPDGTEMEVPDEQP